MSFEVKTETVQKLSIANPSEIPSGTAFRGKLKNRLVSGLIFNNTDENRLYFCQDVISGCRSEFKYGFKHTYAVSYSSCENLNYNTAFVRLEILDEVPEQFADKLDMKPPIVIKVESGDEVRFKSGSIDLGGCSISNEDVRRVAERMGIAV